MIVVYRNNNSQRETLGYGCTLIQDYEAGEVNVLGKDLPVMEHIGELRKRVLWSALFFVLAMIVGLIVAIPIINYLTSVEPVKGLELNAFSPWDGIRIYMQVAVYVGFAISLPFILFQVWLFVKPGLREEEQKASVLYIPGAVLLFFIGLSFAYFVVFPMAFYFTGVITDNLGLTQTYGLAQYFTFMFNILLPLSLMFELPIVVMFLTKLRILNPLRLHRMRRYAYIVLLITSALITPPDLISDLIVCIPMIILYEISLLLSRSIYRRQQTADRAWEEEFGVK
jgi:sec-independent protein translocase protein TatC